MEAEEPEPLGLDRKLARDARGDGGVVDEQCALPHRLKRAVAAERHLPEIIVIADAGQHDIGVPRGLGGGRCGGSAMLRSEEHTSELQSLMRISYAVFCLKNKTK